jgi:hypothetical protein
MPAPGYGVPEVLTEIWGVHYSSPGYFDRSMRADGFLERPAGEYVTAETGKTIPGYAGVM